MPAEWHEPFGLVVGEAQLAGLPVVVSRRGALPEMIRPGKRGRAGRRSDCPALTDVLAALAQDPAPVLAWRQALAAAPPAVADWPQIAGQTVAFYRSVASARSRL
ncbi:glycosyltransferase [Hankyongella ginsenosidimutans]|uniref:Glycosyltransferase n=1 Tax=Hankyongella ginsenosidimutans TaxID=1763828 RepID=A0A4D7C836_9SPHN|nr:glycosyltransferase [Hankyongella ginsenosidimutans]QCI79558.1 glycosyltransferase [Hankyongella ginsenosidimutans]